MTAEQQLREAVANAVKAQLSFPRIAGIVMDEYEKQTPGELATGDK